MANKLKYKYENESDVPAEHRTLYVQSGTAFILDGEDLAPRADLEHLQNRLTHMEVEIAEKKTEYDKAMAAEIEQRKRHESEIADLKKNRGSGASPAVHGHHNDDTTNPFKTGNLTEQAKLCRENPAEYERLQKAN